MNQQSLRLRNSAREIPRWDFLGVEVFLNHLAVVFTEKSLHPRFSVVLYSSITKPKESPFAGEELEAQAGELERRYC